MPEYAIILFVFLVVAVFIQKKYHLTIYQSIASPDGYDELPVSARRGALGSVRDRARTLVFGEQFLLGFRIGYMPIEEFGFTFIMPYFVLVVYRAIERLTERIRSSGKI